MLVRRRGETLAQLLTRLDQAIDRGLTEDVCTDEINSYTRALRRFAPVRGLSCLSPSWSRSVRSNEVTNLAELGS